jgi:hypothetical protein
MRLIVSPGIKKLMEEFSRRDNLFNVDQVSLNNNKTDCIELIIFSILIPLFKFTIYS